MSIEASQSTLSTNQNSAPKPVWHPTQAPSQIPMNIYRTHINQKFNLFLRNSHELHKWSITHPQEFWIHLWSYVGLIPSLPPSITHAYNPKTPITDVPPWFEKIGINYAENVLTQPAVDPKGPALVGLREGQGLHGEVWSWEVLRENVRKVRSALMGIGVKEGDRVAALISTSVWSVGLFLGAASMGAVFTSIAPDLGDEGCISRLSQVNPTMLFADSHVTYKGRQKSNIPKINTIISKLGKKPRMFLIPLGPIDTSTYSTIFEFLAYSSPADMLTYNRLSFNAPLYILYSSGTSGPPKCLVHRHGVILQHKKVGILHNSLAPQDTVFQYSSTSWVLWNIMIGHLSTGARLILYDGSPTFPSPKAMLDIVEKFKVTYWGASPRYLQELEADLGHCGDEAIRGEWDLSNLRMVQSGGAHLAADQYHWFYRTFPSHIHLTSVTGGTDLVTSWVGTDSAGPLYAGEIQLPMLGMDVDIVHPETGVSVSETGESGEFICRTPFPSMPIYMWGDSGNAKYKASYFERFDFPCWAQHDWASRNPVTSGWMVHGRSDGVLNPQGIRFGSSEIYSITEASPFTTSISTTLCVGRRRKHLDKDESVFLFVVPRSGHCLDSTLVHALKDAIRQQLSARHVPRFVIEVNEIPRTVNGKKIETLVKQIISSGQIPKVVSSTVANPACLGAFQEFYYLEEQPKAKL